MTEVSARAPLEDQVPRDGWSTDHLDAWPVSQRRYELTDGALTVWPSLSALHQKVCALLVVRLAEVAPKPYLVTQAVEIRFTRRLTRIADVLVVRSDRPDGHWFAPSEVVVAIEVESPGSHTEERVVRPALYAQYGVPHYWRIELEPELIAWRYHSARGNPYAEAASGPRLTTDEPFPVDLALAELLPNWAR
jgi:hypothetical protein